MSKKQLTDKQRRLEAETQCGLSRMQIYKLGKLIESFDHQEKREAMLEIKTQIYELIDKLDFHLKRS